MLKHICLSCGEKLKSKNAACKCSAKDKKHINVEHLFTPVTIWVKRDDWHLNTEKCYFWDPNDDENYYSFIGWVRKDQKD